MATAADVKVAAEVETMTDPEDAMDLELRRPFAVFSDVHGNLPGLEAVLAEIDRRSLEDVLCLGDLVGYGPAPNEVVETLWRRSTPTLMGNYDDGIGFERGDCGCVYKTDAQKATGAASLAWTERAVTPATRERLCRLHDRFVAQTPAGALLFVHASPRRLNEYVFADRPERSFVRLAVEAERQAGRPLRAVFFGHTHQPYRRDVTLDDGRVVSFVNDGSVGRPTDGDWRSCLTVVDPGAGTGGELVVEVVRVAYDYERLVDAVAGTDLITRFAGPDGRSWE